MRKDPVRVIMYGIGAVGRDMVKPLVNKGVQIVGAIDVDPNIVGKDLGEVVGLDSPLNLVISDDAEDVISSTRADVALVCISTDVKVMFPHLERCIRNSMNVITPTDGLSFPWSIEPEQGARLDKLAREAGVTLMASGIQDPYYIQLVTYLSGTCYNIDTIDLSLTTNLDHGGRAELEMAGIGLPRDVFEQYLAENKEATSAVAMGKSSYMEAVTAGMGLSTDKTTFWAEPIYAEEDTPSVVLEKVIEKGQVLGSRLIAKIETHQGVTFTGTQSFVIFQEGQPDLTDIKVEIKGDPDVAVTCHKLDIHTHICQTIVNRIPDAINAEPGLLTNDQFERPQYRHFPFHYYVN